MYVCMFVCLYVTYSGVIHVLYDQLFTLLWYCVILVLYDYFIYSSSIYIPGRSLEQNLRVVLWLRCAALLLFSDFPALLYGVYLLWYLIAMLYCQWFCYAKVRTGFKLLSKLF